MPQFPSTPSFSLKGKRALIAGAFSGIGITRYGKAADTAPDNFGAAMGINVCGAYFLTQTFAKGPLAADRPGSLVNISNQMGHVCGPARIPFAPTCPSSILTDLTRPTFDAPQRRAWVLDKIKLGRAGRAEDIMGTVAYLAWDAASLVTGTAMLVDGGWTAD